MSTAQKRSRPSRRRRPEAGRSRKRSRYLEPGDAVDIDDIDLLRRFVTEYGKIVPARLTGVTARQQRQIRRGVARARNMGLMA